MGLNTVVRLRYLKGQKRLSLDKKHTSTYCRIFTRLRDSGLRITQKEKRGL